MSLAHHLTQAESPAKIGETHIQGIAMFIEVTERDTNSPVSIGIRYIVNFAPGAAGGTNMELIGCNDWFAVDQDYMTVKGLIAAVRPPHRSGAIHRLAPVLSGQGMPLPSAV